MGQPQTNKCSKCTEDFFVTDNQFFCDKCKPNKKETLSDLDADSDEVYRVNNMVKRKNETIENILDRMQEDLDLIREKWFVM